MHRIHDGHCAQSGFETLRNAGFDNISVDLIFALPASLGRAWLADIEQAVELGPDHISLYGLTIEHATALGKWTDRGSVVPANEDTYAAEFLMAHHAMTAAGYDHYEVSNFAARGKKSRHNSAYWSGAAYLGVGPSAHSFDGETRSWNVAPYAEWVERLSAGELPTLESERLSEENMLAEKVYLGLRTRDGLVISDSDRESANRWRSEGWADMDGDRVRLTSEGWLRLDSLAAALTGL
jgi:oxygen-independent coproporphyrinogen-3 oxidase